MLTYVNQLPEFLIPIFGGLNYAKLPLKIKIFMWLVEKNSILTRDNLTRRGWHRDKRCNFCLENESVNHLFFDCSMARYIWSLVAYAVGTDCRPCSFDQFWLWAKQFFPLSENFLYVGLAAICWAIWRMRNKIHFDKKVVRSPTEIICLASFMFFLGRIAVGRRQVAVGSWRWSSQEGCSIISPARSSSRGCRGGSTQLMEA